VRIGIFGGTFDPIHNVHLFVAESARLLERLDRVLFVPTNNQHYRTSAQVDDAHRCAMILGAIADNPAFALDDSDLGSATGYTADLLPRLQTKYPDAQFTFIIGEVLAALERFVIAPRSGVGVDALQRVLAAVPGPLRERIDTLNLPELPESATLVRTLLGQGRSVRYLVPNAVWQYIEARNLYAASTSSP
jgi:nicotinate-nucleotide adenylyltransferase